MIKCELFNNLTVCEEMLTAAWAFPLLGGGGATRPLPRNGGVGGAEELHGGPTVWLRPKVWTRGQK